MAKAKAKKKTAPKAATKRKRRAKARAKPAAEVEDEDEPDEPGDEEADAAPARRRARKPAGRRAKKPTGRSSRASDAQTEGPADEPEGPDGVPAKRPRRARGAPVDLGQALQQAAATSERINQFLLENLDPAAWNAKPPGEGRTIAAIVSHVHNVRRMWLQVSAPEHGVPEKLDRRTVTIGQAKTALGESFLALRGLIERSLEAGGKVKDFKPDVVGFLAYLVAHESHHRGQIALLAREVGHALPKDAGYGMWDWRKRWQECGFDG